MQLFKYKALFILAILGMIGLVSAGKSSCKQYKKQLECRQCCWDQGREYISSIQILALGCYCGSKLPANVMV